MNKQTYILTLVLFLTTLVGWAQPGRLLFHGGIMTERVALDSAFQRMGFNFLTVHAGGYVVLAHKADVVSLGIDASLQGGLQFANRKISSLAQMPLFLVGRWGTEATAFNEQKTGMSLGIGGLFNYLNIRGIPGQDQEMLSLSTFFINPSILLEGRVKMKQTPVTGRLHASLSGPYQEGLLPVAVNGNRTLFESFQTRYLNLGWGILFSF